MKLLAADDDPISLRMLTGLLTSLNYEVVTATDGDEAWRVLQQPEAPKLAILDWMMPGFSVSTAGPVGSSAGGCLILTGLLRSDSSPVPRFLASSVTCPSR